MQSWNQGSIAVSLRKNSTPFTAPGPRTARACYRRVQAVSVYVYDFFVLLAVASHRYSPDLFLFVILWEVPNSVIWLLVLGRYESSVDAEVQQRCVEYLMLCEKGPVMVDIMAEMPKFPERQVCCNQDVECRM